MIIVYSCIIFRLNPCGFGGGFSRKSAERALEFVSRPAVRQKPGRPIVKKGLHSHVLSVKIEIPKGVRL